MTTLELVTSLKNLTVERLNLEEVMALLAPAANLQATYEAVDIDTPPWLTTAVDLLGKQAQMLHEDALEAQLSRAEQELEGLKTPTERRADVKDRIRELRGRLGKG